MKKILCALLTLLLLFGCAAEPAVPAVAEPPAAFESAADVTAALSRRGGYRIRAAVLHSGGETWKATLDYLLQPLVLNLEAEGAETGADLSGYDVLYLDESLLGAPEWDALSGRIQEFTAAGGAVLVPNTFAEAFPLDYLGAEGFEPLPALPGTLTLPEGLTDLSGLQSIVADFHKLYLTFSDIETLRSRGYGVAMRPSTALPLVLSGEAALYAVNRYGDGAVLFVNPLLPNAYIQADFTMEPRDEAQPAFAPTAASCNQLLYSEWASYAAKLRYGFSLERVFGYFGTPSLAWELHYEDITAIEHDSMRIFSELAEQARQIPSYTLIRNTYWWFARVETMSYLLGRAGEDVWRMDYEENAYASGAHVDSGGKWLTQGWLEQGGSYFDPHPEHRYRLYPCALDYNGDGRDDFFCGTRSGEIYYYENLGMTGLDGRLRVSEARALTGPDGAPLNPGGYSAPALLDLDGDGFLDLVSGSDDGCLYWYRGGGTLTFEPRGVLLDTGFQYQALPSAGDVDGDGVLDLAVGSEEGILLVYYGGKDGAATVYSHERMSALSRDCADWELGKWLSPCLTDYDGDGKLDLLVGTFGGFLALLPGDGAGGFTFGDYLRSNEWNDGGDDRVRFGNLATPALTDLDGDGVRDLVCGYREYGLTYPIDSPYFPFRDQLQAQADYASDHRYYFGLHFLTNPYASAAREASELASHKRAMDAYGIPTEGIGANQHTWHISRWDTAQSMKSLWDAGLLWQSGYESSGGSFAPQYAPEAVISLPFFRVEDGERTILMQDCSVLLYLGTEFSGISAKYGVPMLAYYHCDYVYNSDQDARAKLQQVSEFRHHYGYNMNREDQLMRASAAAYNLAVDVRAADGAFTIAPRAVSTGFPLYDAQAQSSMGLRIEFADALAGAFSHDARVWKQIGNGFALGLDGPVAFRPGAQDASPHLLQLNVPAAVSCDGGGATVAFTGDGMMQAVVAGEAETADPGWVVDHYKAGDGGADDETARTVFTKFGAADTLRLTYAGGEGEKP